MIETRVFKGFSKGHFFFTRSCATAMPWDSVNKQSNPDDTWEIWKKLLMQIIDKRRAALGIRTNNSDSCNVPAGAHACSWL